MAIIYQITNLVNGNRYIGATRFDVHKRWSEHKFMANSNPRSWFHRAIKKHGFSNFQVDVIASCIGNVVENWSALEREIIKDRKPEYNMTNGGEITLGRKNTIEVIEKIAQKNKGKKRTSEMKLANSLQAKARYKNNPEYKQKITETLIKNHKNRELWEDKRLEGIRRAAKEGKMARILSEEHKTKLISSSNNPESIKKNAEKHNKKVICITTGLIFDSITKASEQTGLSISGISKVCLGKRKACRKMVFKFY